MAKTIGSYMAEFSSMDKSDLMKNINTQILVFLHRSLDEDFPGDTMGAVRAIGEFMRRSIASDGKLADEEKEVISVIVAVLKKLGFDDAFIKEALLYIDQDSNLSILDMEIFLNDIITADAAFNMLLSIIAIDKDISEKEMELVGKLFGDKCADILEYEEKGGSTAYLAGKTE